MRFCKQCGSIYPSETQYCPVHGGLLETRDEFKAETKVNGRYEILRRIGSGAMADVFLVRDQEFYSGNLFAMKVPNARMAADPQSLARFIDEANKARLLNHRYIVRFFHLDKTESGLPLFLMEYVEGESLRKWMNRDPKLQWRHAVEITIQVAEALESAHADGVVHCDIKPENIISTSVRHPTPLKVLDFGVGKATNSLRAKLGGTGQGTVFAPSDIAGTPEYMAPEQAIARENVSEASDIYSLGVVLYEMLTGTVPFVGIGSVEEARRTHQDQRPGSLHGRRELPAGLADLVERMLDRSPELRPTATEVIQKIKELDSPVIPPPQVKSNGRRIAAVTAGVALILGVVLLFATKSKPTITPRSTEDSQMSGVTVASTTKSPEREAPAQTPATGAYSNILDPTPPESQPSPTGQLRISCDLSCSLTLDGVSQGDIESGNQKDLTVRNGRHMVSAAVSADAGFPPQEKQTTISPSKTVEISFSFKPGVDSRNQRIADAMQRAEAKANGDDLPGAVEAYNEVLRLVANKSDPRYQAADTAKGEVLKECRINNAPCNTK